METQIRKLKERVVEAHKNKRNQPRMPNKENNYESYDDTSNSEA